MVETPHITATRAFARSLGRAFVRPTPRPGLSILRCDVRSWQAGLEWPGVATLADNPSVRAVLDAIDGFRDIAGVARAAAATGVSPDEVQSALDALIDAGLVVDERVVRPAAVDEDVWAAWWLLAGPEATAADIARHRRGTRAWVTGRGRLSDAVRRVLDDERVPVARTLAEATVHVVAADHELARDTVDEAMRRGVPFLCASLRDLVGVVGPFVVPGRTACLRCVDLARAQRDPCWPTLIASTQVARPRTMAVAPSLAAVTGSYAASETALWASGFLPVTCDAVVEIPHGIGQVQTVAYQPHPACGCGWSEPRETMSA